MASNIIIPVSSASSSSPELASFLLSDGVGAGFVRHRDIWWKNDQFLAMVWGLIKAPRKDGTLLKLLYIRHTVVETELVAKFCSERLGCRATGGAVPSEDVRVTAMTFAQARRHFTNSGLLCENMVILVDGAWLETVDTEIGMGLMNQSINPASSVKIIGLYSEDWDDQAAEKAVPLLSPLFKQAGVRKLPVTFAGPSMTEADPEPIGVNQLGLLNRMVDCASQGKHILFFMPSSMVPPLASQVDAMLQARRGDVGLRFITLRSNSSMTKGIDGEFTLGAVLESHGYIFSQPDRGLNTVLSFIIVVDPEAGFTTVPVKQVGLVVYSHVSAHNDHTQFNTKAKVAVYTEAFRKLSLSGVNAQRQSCRGIDGAPRIWMASNYVYPSTAHPADHSKAFALELIRGWPGKSMGEIPLNLERRDVRSLDRTMGHLAVTGIIEPYQNGYALSKAKGAEMLALLPAVSKYDLSFELVGLLASVKHCVPDQRAMRLLIRLAVFTKWEASFLSGLTPAADGDGRIPWGWMQHAGSHMAGPARSQMATGRPWFALGIWDKMRKDTENFSIPGLDLGPGENGQHSLDFAIEGLGTFDRDDAIEIYRAIADLELRLGLPLLEASDPEWEQPLGISEMHDVQAQLISAFISGLAVWDLETDRISLLGSGHQVHLAQDSLIVHPRIAKIESRPEKAYLVVAHRVKEAANGRLLVESASCMGISLLRVTSLVLGEPASDWLKWL
ncbi:hypothetical protein KVR01_013203 [Diaporthe batatas]|uniref:uncharacterized protein n=1 Tax=Diaporthe batatas TaxID=748121 RepID=UPI001D04780F|nr:uncharacterized protein KVR01_013203 [Diaporthe batatas]KAG8156981.1 hypothetical protein KVR01_013203 [Diaporthe batatas]